MNYEIRPITFKEASDFIKKITDIMGQQSVVNFVFHYMKVICWWVFLFAEDQYPDILTMV